MSNPMIQGVWNSQKNSLSYKATSAPCSHIKPFIDNRPKVETFHIAHKVPIGDTPYVRAKRVQLVDKDPERAISLFWAAINAGDRVDSALKDMAIVMKQQNRAEEAIEAIKSLRYKCSDQAQESLDNILLDLYKRCGRLDDQIALLKRKLQLIKYGYAFNGKRTKTARSQGKKFQVSIQQEATRLLGNLGWALMQKENYKEAEQAYIDALLIEPDNNKMCNLGICLMKQGKLIEARNKLQQVKPATVHGLRGADSHLKAYERAQEMLFDLESKYFDSNNTMFLGSSSVWQPQPCSDNYIVHGKGEVRSNMLNSEAMPFYPPPKESRNPKRKCSSKEGAENRFPELPDDDAFDEAILEAVLRPILEDEQEEEMYYTQLKKEKTKKRLKVFEDITVAMNSPPPKVLVN